MCVHGMYYILLWWRWWRDGTYTYYIIMCITHSVRRQYSVMVVLPTGMAVRTVASFDRSPSRVVRYRFAAAAAVCVALCALLAQTTAAADHESSSSGCAPKVKKKPLPSTGFLGNFRRPADEERFAVVSSYLPLFPPLHPLKPSRTGRTWPVGSYVIFQYDYLCDRILLVNIRFFRPRRRIGIMGRYISYSRTFTFTVII